jgi:hypothetical protein
MWIMYNLYESSFLTGEYEDPRTLCYLNNPDVSLALIEGYAVAFACAANNNNPVFLWNPRGFVLNAETYTCSRQFSDLLDGGRIAALM